jgi:hypothetical protein
VPRIESAGEHLAVHARQLASVTGPPVSIPFERNPVAGALLLSGVGARPPPDGV